LGPGGFRSGFGILDPERGGGVVRQNGFENKTKDNSSFRRLIVLGGGFKVSPVTGKSLEKFLSSFSQKTFV
jgi:hypothetical protein